AARWDSFRFCSPDETDDLAADAALLRGPAGHQPVRRGQDRGAHASEYARHAVLARVDPAARFRHPLQVRDHTLTAAAVLQFDDERVERLALLHAKAADVALLLEEPGDVLLQP